MKKYGFCIDLHKRRSLSVQITEEDLETRRLELDFDFEFLMNVPKENKIENKSEEDFFEKMLQTKKIEEYKDLTPPFVDGKELIFIFLDYQPSGKEYLLEKKENCLYDEVLDHFYDFSEEVYYCLKGKDSLM